MSADAGPVAVEVARDVIVLQRPRFGWQVPVWGINFASAPGSLQTAPRWLRVSARVILYGGIAAAVILGLREDAILAVLPLMVALAALGVGLIDHLRRPEFVFDGPNAQLRISTRRREQVIPFAELDGVHWWHDRWTGAKDDAGVRDDRYEVYVKRGATRVVLGDYGTRSEAESLCAQLQELVSRFAARADA